MQISLVCFVYTQGRNYKYIIYFLVCRHFTNPAESTDCTHADHGVGIELRTAVLQHISFSFVCLASFGHHWQLQRFLCPTAPVHASIQLFVCHCLSVLSWICFFHFLTCIIRFRGMLQCSFLFLFVLGLFKCASIYSEFVPKKRKVYFKSCSPRSRTIVDHVSWAFPMKRYRHYPPLF